MNDVKYAIEFLHHDEVKKVEFTKTVEEAIKLRDADESMNRGDRCGLIWKMTLIEPK